MGLACRGRGAARSRAAEAAGRAEASTVTPLTAAILTLRRIFTNMEPVLV